MEFLMKIEGFGYFRALFLKSLYQIWPFWVTKIEMCLTGSITSENKGGGGQTPYGRKP